MDIVSLELKLCLEDQRQFNCAKKLLSHQDDFVIPGAYVVRTLNSLRSFLETTTDIPLSSDSFIHKQQFSKKGIQCDLEFSINAPEGLHPRVIAMVLSFPRSGSKLKFIGPTDQLFSVYEEKKWGPIEHEWNNVAVKVTFELLDVAGSSSSPATEDFLPSPIYHFLLELLKNYPTPFPLLQVGLVKTVLLSLRSGKGNEIAFFGDAVLSNICRDLLLPLTQSSVIPSNHYPQQHDNINDSNANGHPNANPRGIKDLRSLAVFRALFHGPSGTGKTRIARFIFEQCGFRGIFCGTPTQLNREFKEDVGRLKRFIDEQLAAFPEVPSVFILDDADDYIPPLGSLPLLLQCLDEFPNMLFIAVTHDARAVDKNFFRTGRIAHVYFGRPYARNRTEILAQTLALHGFWRAAAALRIPLVRSVDSRLRKLVCGRTGGQLIALAEACVRRCALDDPSNADPTWEYVLPRLERTSRDFAFAADPDTCDWSAGEEIAPPEQWNEAVLGANHQLSGRVLVDVEEGKLVLEYYDGKVLPLWYARNPRGPCVPHQLALGFAASLIEPSTVLVVDSRRQELITGDVEASMGFARLLADLRSAGSRGGALVVLDVDDLVGVVKDSSSRVLLINRLIQDPVHKYDSTKLLREHVMHKIISFSALAGFVKDFNEKNFCIVVAVTRDPFVHERLTAAFHANVPFSFETSFIPKGLHVSLSSIGAQDEEDDAAGCICAKMELQKGESYFWIVQVFISAGFVSLGVVHSSVNTVAGRFNLGSVGENLGSWGFRIMSNCVEVCQTTSLPSKAILSPLPEAHENPMRTTIRNNRTIFGAFLQSTATGIFLHLLRFLHEHGSSSPNRWEHVAFKKIDNLEGLNLMPAFGISKKASSISILACHRVSSTWFPCDALPDAHYSPVFVPALHTANSVELFKGGFHLNSTSVYLDKTRIPSGKKALVRFHIHDKTPAVVSDVLTRTHSSGMNVLFRILPENAPRLSVGFIKETEATNIANLACSSIYGYNPILARCYYGHDGERDVPSLTENPQRAGYLYIDLCPTSPYCGSIHYFKIRVLGNLLYCGSLIEGLPNETYRTAISFDDPTTEQGKSLGTFGTAKIGAGLGRECLPVYIPEWYPLDYGVQQGLLSFSPDPNTIRQEKDGMNSRFTKELAPINVDWHYIECRIYSCTGSSQVILGFIPSGELAGTLNTHVGAKGTPGFGYNVHSGEVHLGTSGALRAATKFNAPPKDYIRVGLLLSAKLGEVHLFWAEVGSPGPVDYKGLLFENVIDTAYRFVVSASHAGTTVSWRGFSCNGSLPQAKANVLARNLEFHELSGNVAYASRNYVMFSGMDIIGDDVSVITNATPQQLREEADRLGAGAFTSSGTIKDYAKIYQRMRIVGNRVELAGLIGPVCSDFCLRVYIQGYVFIPQHDAVGDEVDAESAELLTVAHRCTQDTSALAFNTGGLIKYSLKSWILYLADPGASGCFSGIFVKQSYMCMWLGTLDPKQCLNTIRSLVVEAPPQNSEVHTDNWTIN